MPKVKAQGNQTVTNGATTTAANFPGTGCVYNWVNDTPGIGLAASGTGNIASFTAVNTGSSAVTATITATPVPAGFAYIANFGSNTVSVINTTTDAVVATVPVGNSPMGVAVSPDGGIAYVANSNSSTVSVINASTNNVIATIPVGLNPDNLVVSYDGNFLYVINSSSSNISVISTATNAVLASIPVNPNPFGIAVSPDGSRLYVTYGSDGTVVSVISTATQALVSNVPVNKFVFGVAVSPDGREVYVTNYVDGTVQVINAATNMITATISIGGAPYGIAVSPDGTKVYVATNNAPGGTVTVINTLTNAIIAMIVGNGGPYGISVSPDGSTVYVTNVVPGEVSVINTATNTVIDKVNVGSLPESMSNFVTGGIGCSGAPIAFTITVNPAAALLPTITTSTVTGTISACAGANSASPNIQQFTLSGSNLSNNIIVTAPTGFEVSLIAGSGYGSSVTIPQSGGPVNSTIIYVRSAASASPGIISGKVVITSGPTTQNVMVNGIVNAWPTVNAVSNQTFANGTVTTGVTFTGTANIINWVNNNPGIGLPASGTGNISPFTAINTGNSPVIATISATPVSVGYAYVANSISNDLSVINTTTNSIVATIPVGQTPTSVTVSPDGTRVYVTNQRANTISVINTATNFVISTITVAAFSPTSVAVSPDGKELYVVNLNSNNVLVFSTVTNTVLATIGVGGYPVGIVVSPNGSMVYVANSSNTISVIDASTEQVKTTIPVGNSPYGIAISPDGNTVYVAMSGANNVTLINTNTNMVTGTIPVGSNPAGVTVSPNGNYVYVSNQTSNSVSVINTSTNKVVYTIPVGLNPLGLSFSPDGSMVYVANEDANTVSIINTATNTVTATVNVGSYPISLGNFVTGGTGCSGISVNFTITVNPTVLSVITAAGTLSPLNTIYGTSSPSAIFTVSGTNMTAGILVSPPLGFEVSTDDITFSSTVTVGAAGTIAPATVYIRLASSTPVGNYSGNIVLSGGAAANVSVPMPLSTVTPATLTIIADNESKFFGAVNPLLTVTYSGFVNNDSPAQLIAQPIVTTTAITTSPAGQYPITASGAASPNYTFIYVQGILTITGSLQMVVIPNTFTPNGDGINDTWDIKNLDSYVNCTVQIFTRYGENVYSSIGYGVPWNGTYKGAALPPGTYYYIINLKNSSKLLSGFVAIIR